jgi:hypothetical protein
MEEEAVNRVRATGRPSDLIPAAARAAAAIRDLVPEPASTTSGEEREALVGLKRLLFNAAADCWPGWEVDSASVTHAELVAARDLAVQSAQLVEQLDLGPVQGGNAQWLIGAFELALGSFDAALVSFAQAEAMFERGGASGLMLLARGYIAIALESAGQPGGDATPDLPAILESIAAGNFPDGAALSDQLKTAHKVFV